MVGIVNYLTLDLDRSASSQFPIILLLCININIPPTASTSDDIVDLPTGQEHAVLRTDRQTTGGSGIRHCLV